MDKKPTLKKVDFIQKIGGYYFWSWKFPFVRWVSEEFVIISGSKVYKWDGINTANECGVINYETR